MSESAPAPVGGVKDFKGKNSGSRTTGKDNQEGKKLRPRWGGRIGEVPRTCKQSEKKRGRGALLNLQGEKKSVEKWEKN